jgi:D-alanyl-lipoteichoic acid acyltransferase DltB (MBOAT superfamily)
MLFNSLDFAVFLPIVFFLYWFVTKRSLKLQNVLIVAASYVFYGWWDWRFLSLILFSTIVDYLVGLALHKKEDAKTRKLLLWTSIAVNIGFLGFFKYYNFFLENFQKAFTFFGSEFSGDTLNIVLPVGISFYTFQTLSYSIDIYKRKLEPTKNFIAFSAFVSFFPQLVAGPIERASNLLPQFYTKRHFDSTKAVDGLRQILWGLFKKVVIADNCAEQVNIIFSNPESYNGSTLFIGAVLFAFQIYGDFSGYSDIAIGTARLFGFNLKQNFAFPYFSRDIAEFWRRWHISLSTWFRDYLYIPLGGSRGGRLMSVRNTFIIFVVSGFWHGANWTFITWGAVNAILFLPLLLIGQNRRNLHVVAHNKLFPSFLNFLSILGTFILTTLTWVFFRADDIQHAAQYFSGIFSPTIISNVQVDVDYVYLIIFFIIIEWIGRANQYGMEKIGVKWPRFLRWFFYGFLIFLIGMYMPTEESPFIYFQF